MLMKRTEQMLRNANLLLANTSYESVNEFWHICSNVYPPDARMLTRFHDNQLLVDDQILAAQSGSVQHKSA